MTQSATGIFRSRTVVWTVFIVGVLEGGSRLFHWNARPMIPFTLDGNGAPRMVADLDISVRLPGHERIRIITDSLGARVGSRAAALADRRGGILVVGDSQALGWGLDFSATLGAQLGKRLGG